MERLIDWDVKISDGRIEYFDPELSYEATGYRPINDTEGLDFDPRLFTKTAKAKKDTGKYCPYRFGSKEFREFWTEEGWRCREGYTVNGYTITGDNYYFINFYQLLSLDVSKAGEGRSYQTPDFYVEQYKYFHYVELCRIYGYNACTLKARGIGWSEINASMVANMYTWRPNTRSLITAFSDFYVNSTVKKAFDQLDYLNANTEGGMRRLRQVKDQALFRRSSHVSIVDGQKVESGQRSEIVGLVVDEPRKMRSDRVEILLMDEGGCHAKGTDIMMADGRLKKVEDVREGDFVMGNDGTPRKVIQLHRGVDTMYRIRQDNGDEQVVNSNHIIYGKKLNPATGEYEDFEMRAKDFFRLTEYGRTGNGRYKLTHSDKVSFPHRNTLTDPYVFGLQIGMNGCNDIPECYIYNDRNTLLRLVAGFIDSYDGCVRKSGHEIAVRQNEGDEYLVGKIEFVCRMLGMGISKGVNQSVYDLIIDYGDIDVPFKVKKIDVDTKKCRHSLDNTFTIEKMETGEYYGFSLDGNQLFLLGDFTVCHNSWPDSEKAYEQAKSLVELQGRRVGNVFIFGTGGDKGPNLHGLKEIFNNPRESEVLGYRHNYTRSGEYCITGYFVPAWSIVRDYMDERGYTSEKDGKAFFQKERDKLAPTPKKLLLNCAEKCWYPEEALALEGDDRFNTAILTEQKQRIVLFKQTPKEWIPKRGRLDYTFAGGRVEKDNIDGIEFVPDANGDLCIIEPPVQAEDGKVYRNLYVAGIDGIDLGNEDTEDSSKKSGSDFCIVIKKRMQGLKEPMYVAYYRARPENIKEAYLQALRLIQWYNAKALIEKTRIGFLSFMDSKKMKYRYMMRKPRALEPDKGRPVNSQTSPFGAPANDAAIAHGLTLIADFVEEYCHTIWIPEMIDELINYSYKDKRKYDMVAAMQMAELADEELSSTVIQTEDSSFKTNNQKVFMYGYYIDERGYKRRGRIDVTKKKAVPTITFESERYGDGNIYTSNPLYNGDFSDD